MKTNPFPSVFLAVFLIQGCISTKNATLLGATVQRISFNVAYHVPFPALGHVVSVGTGYRWEPVPWQLSGFREEPM
ncbi:MAG: hypothetical protein H7Z75_00145 [Ferruginibacter sp.]|nr:hypothetical protein [Cytophagales bacterium]